jgi:hypothetical protein
VRKHWMHGSKTREKTQKIGRKEKEKIEIEKTKQ